MENNKPPQIVPQSCCSRSTDKDGDCELCHKPYDVSDGYCATCGEDWEYIDQFCPGPPTDEFEPLPSDDDPVRCFFSVSELKTLQALLEASQSNEGLLAGVVGYIKRSIPGGTEQELELSKESYDSLTCDCPDCTTRDCNDC